MLAVLAKRVSKQPKLIIVDFEKALLNSFRKYFPNTRIGGCYFHFAKNLWANFSKKGLQQRYDKKCENKIFKTFAYLKCLAFVPVDDVIPAFLLIKEQADSSLSGFLHYFETYYIGIKKNKNSSLRKIPSFPIKLWNVRERVLNDEPRTNNGIEAWHCAFNGTVKNAHPTIYKLIKEFTLEQQSVELWIKQASSGETNKQSKKQIAVNERIKNVCLSYNSENIMEFFNNLYPNLKN